MYFGNLLVKQTKECDGSVAGAVNSSGATVSSAIKTIGLEAGVSTLSSFFIMVRHFVLLLTVSYCFLLNRTIVPKLTNLSLISM